MTNLFSLSPRHAVRPGAPVLLWVVVSVAALAGGLDSVALGVAASAVALALGGSLPGRIMTVAAVVPVAVLGDLPAAGWIVSAGLLAGAYEFAPSAGPAHVARRALAELDLHIARCRRRDEAGHVLVVRGLDPDDEPLDLFRLTDSVAVRLAAGGPELRAVIDDASFDRDALEQRIRDRLGPATQVGWAKFPDDGVTLEVLLEHARDAARDTVPVSAAATRPAVYPVPRALAAETAAD